MLRYFSTNITENASKIHYQPLLSWFNLSMLSKNTAAFIVFYFFLFKIWAQQGNTWECENRNAAQSVNSMTYYYALTLHLSLLGPNRLTAFASSHSGKHKDRICLWLKSTPTFLSYMLTSVLGAPLSYSLPLCTDKTLAYIAV